MSRNIRENILVPKMDLPIVAPGTQIFVQSKDRNSPSINGIPGQVVVFDPKEGVALGPNDLTKAEHGTVVFGVIVDTNGDGLANAIKRPFGDMIYGCNIEGASVRAPECGVAEVKDFLFRCTNSNDEYSITVTVEDETTQKQYPYNRPAEYTYSVRVQTDSCEDCTVEDASRKVACKFAEAFNHTVWNENPILQGRIMPLDKVEKSFEAVALYSNEYVFCIDPVQVSDHCKDCIHVEAIKGITIEGEDPINFTNTTDPGNSEVTLRAQLDHVVYQINSALGDFGTAVLTKGAGSCCPYQLKVNTCKTVTNLLTEGGVIEPCSTSNPLDPVTFDNECKDCGDPSGSDVTFLAGIRIISKPVELPIPCTPIEAANQPIKFYGRHIDIFPAENFQNSSWHKRTVQPMILPNGVGYEWVWRDYASSVGGEGRDKNPYNRRYGRFGLPGPNDKITGVDVDCQAMYCVYSLNHSIPHGGYNSEGISLSRGRTVWLIDKRFTTLKNSFEEALNAYITDTTCGSIGPLECDIPEPEGEGGEGGVT